MKRTNILLVIFAFAVVVGGVFWFLQGKESKMPVIELNQKDQASTNAFKPEKDQNSSYLQVEKPPLSAKYLGPQYYLYEGKIYYWDDGGGQAAPGMVLIDASPESFTILKNEHCEWDKKKDKFDPCRRYAKDDKKVFYASYEIKDADPETFQILKGLFAKDAGHVFYDARKIEGINPNTFELIGIEYGRDNTSVVYEENKIYGADPKTFEVLHEKYCLAYANALAKDKNSYYWRAWTITEKQYYEYIKSEAEEIKPIIETCN
jgi:hypothetical protein